MKLFIFFSLVFLLISFTFGQEQKREELQALIDEAIKQNPEIAAEQSRLEMMQEGYRRRALWPIQNLLIR